MKMKLNLKTLLSLSLVMLSVGCANVQPGSDKLVVRAEQTRAAATETFNSFVVFEYTNREALWKSSKEIKHTADYVRAYGKSAIEELTKSIETYKVLKTSNSSGALNNNIIVVTDILTRAVTVYTQGRAALMEANK